MPGPWEDYAPQAEPQPPGPWDEFAQPGVLEDVAKTIPSALARGATTLLGFPGDIKKYVVDAPLKWALGPPPAPPPAAPGSVASMLEGVTAATQQPTSQQVTGALEDVTGPLYQPQTTTGKYVNTVGEMLPSALVAGPGGLARRAITQGVIPGVASEAAGQATEGTGYESAARIAGAIAGGAIPGTAARAVTPLPNTPARQGLVNTLLGEGITPTAGKTSGRQGLQYFESEMGGAATRRATEAEQQAVNRAVLQRAGENADIASPPTIHAASTRISNQFNGLTARNNLNPDTQFMRDMMAAQRSYLSNTAQTFQVPLVQNLVTDISQQLARHGYLPGRYYQNLRSDIGNAARGAIDRSPSEARALRAIQSALDDAMERSITTTNPGDLGAFQETRRQYANLQHIIHSVTAKSGAAGNIDLGRLRQSQTSFMGEQAYASGRGELNALTHAGEEILKPLPQSGTAPRTAARNVIPLTSAAVGGALGHQAGGAGGLTAGVAAGAALPYLLNRAAGQAVMSPSVQRYLRNQALAGPAANLSQDPARAALIQILMGPSRLAPPQ